MACPMYERVALFLIMFSIRLLDYMARQQVQSEAAGQRRRSRAGCLAGYTPGYGRPDGFRLARLARLYRALGARGWPGAAAAISSRPLIAC